MAICQVEIISKETIKPSSPTPTHQRTYKLPFLDQATPHNYIPIVLFYPNVCFENSPSNTAETSRKLKQSLSQILTRYYPFAGRLQNGGASIDCNDEGVDFFETRIKCSLSEFLKKPDIDSLDILYPEQNNDYLVVVQTTFFECGGISVAVSMMHKIGDVCTLSTFASAWATMTSHWKSENQVAADLYPPPPFISSYISQNSKWDLPWNDPSIVPEMVAEKRHCITRRFVFEAEKIAELKAKATETGVEKPTQVEVLTALFFKTAMSASTKAHSGHSRPATLVHMVNLRPRINPPLPEKSVGNFSWFFPVMPKDESQRNLEGLVRALREGLCNFCDKYTKNMSADQCYSLLIEGMNEGKKGFKNEARFEVDVYKCSSFCRYPFNEMDFGWGRPIWVAMAGTSTAVIKNTVHLIDGPNGSGVEAWVTLEEEEMAIFETDEELLAFASLNPSILIT